MSTNPRIQLPPDREPRKADCRRRSPNLRDVGSRTLSI